MVQITAESLQQLTSQLVDAIQLRRIYLFGSHADGSATTGSDLDLLIVVPSESYCVRDLDRTARGVLGSANCGVDIVWRTEEEFDRRASWPSSLEATVVVKGRLLYGS